ncbi:dicarboxylate transporter/tellurite-resistance protein TehA [Rhodoferax sp. BLA1]|uniref:dicarboxylate transporter/tellurite-resistance protein TehA n=1 Tax=Rhodoferax sp. BLA1 TaxID=2576062 RepID=UPI0015D0FAEF
MAHSPVSASFFGIVLGLSGLGQAWRIASRLWGMPSLIGEGVLLLSAVIWLTLLVFYLVQAVRYPEVTRHEFRHPVQGSTPALLAVSTLLMVLAVLPYSRPMAWTLAVAGITWHVVFSLWHTGVLWQGGRDMLDTAPTLYLPTVAGNFTSAAALGGLGHPDWGWLFLGAGVFSWLSLESLVIQRLWQSKGLPVAQRPLVGIQFAPPVVCAMAWLMLDPGSTDHWLMMMWGYGLFQLLLGLRLGSWLGAQPFSPAYWAYTFGISATTVCGLKLAVAGVGAAQVLAMPIFIGANLFIAYLAVRTAWHAAS